MGRGRGFNMIFPGMYANTLPPSYPDKYNIYPL